MAKLIEQLQAQYKRHHRLVVAFTAGLILTLTYAISVERVGNGTVVAPPLPTSEVVATSTDVADGLGRSAPVTLRIPKIQLEADFAGPLGLNEDGTVAVTESYEEVGWYEFGPTPGELGPAVVLGHVDSYQGPAVFYSLGQLQPGDEIFIDRADGKTVRFLVEHLERHDQDDFPTIAVYGDINHAGLRLITCSGVYSHSTLRYSHNLIVFARMVEE